MLSENREIKLSALERFPQELLAHRLTTESPPLQKKNQIQHYFDKAQKKKRQKLKGTELGFQP